MSTLLHHAIWALLGRLFQAVDDALFDEPDEDLS